MEVGESKAQKKTLRKGRRNAKRIKNEFHFEKNQTSPMQTDSVYKSVDVDLTHRASRFGCEADFKIQNKFFQLEKHDDRLIKQSSPNIVPQPIPTAFLGTLEATIWKWAQINNANTFTMKNNIVPFASRNLTPIPGSPSIPTTSRIAEGTF